MEQLRIRVLNDNTAGRFCLAEHGLSFLVETERKYLFDVSSSDLFLENARRLKINLSDVDTIVLSHGHDDHTGGLRYLKNKTLIGHPAIFMKRYRRRNNTPLGLPFTREEAEQKYAYQLKLSSTPLKLDAFTWFLGEVPRLNNFESIETPFVDEFGNDDFVPDDSGLAVETPKGLVVISGCAHAGICNMISHAQRVTGVERVYGVIGGFHLSQIDLQTQKTIDFLKDLRVEKVMPSHCTALPALTGFLQNFDFIQVKSGNLVVF